MCMYICVDVCICVCTGIYCIYIYPKNIWGIGNDADNYIDGNNNLSAILS